MYEITCSCHFKVFLKLQQKKYIGTQSIWRGKKYSWYIISVASPGEWPADNADQERNVYNTAVHEDRRLNKSRCTLWQREMKRKKETYKAFCWRFACPPGFWCCLVRIFPMVTRQSSTTWTAQSQNHRSHISVRDYGLVSLFNGALLPFIACKLLLSLLMIMNNEWKYSLHKCRWQEGGSVFLHESFQPQKL
jgi:hypothetical protein